MRHPQSPLRIVHGNIGRHRLLIMMDSSRPTVSSERKTTNLTIRPIASVFERAVLTDPDPRRSTTPSGRHFRLSYLVEDFWRDLFIHTTTTGPGGEGLWSSWRAHLLRKRHQRLPPIAVQHLIHHTEIIEKVWGRVDLEQGLGVSDRKSVV